MRFFHQKERFGVYAGFPMSRYIRGLQRTTVPDRAHEHDGNGNYVGDQDTQANCVNPIYAQNLPTSSSQELCKLQLGPRSGQQNLIYYAAITGVPHQLLQSKPGDSDTASGAGDGCPAGTPAAKCPQKLNLSAADWKLILGNDPEHYDFSGSDFHMIESEQDRTSSTTDPSSPVWANHSTCPEASADNCDPINGREWATKKSDLQWACTFPLIHVDATNTIQSFQKDCTSNLYKDACDCQTAAINSNTQLCAEDGSGNYTTTQINGKAYPTIDEAHRRQGDVELAGRRAAPKPGDRFEPLPDSGRHRQLAGAGPAGPSLRLQPGRRRDRRPPQGVARERVRPAEALA